MTNNHRVKSPRRAPAAPLDQPRVLTVAIDVGYGRVKALMTPTGEHSGSMDPFPSVYGMKSDVKFRADELSRRYPGDEISDEDGDWFVGNLAQSQVPQGQLIMLRGRTGDEEISGNAFRLRMVKVALGKLLAGERNGDVFHVRLATGLPVDHMPDAAGLKKALLGTFPVRTDTANIVVNVTEVMVMPQPVGALYSQTLTPAGEINAEYLPESTGVVDVGTYTVDISLEKRGEFIGPRSGSAESGVYTARARIAEALEKELREKPSEAVIDEVLRSGCVKVQGKLRDYRRVVEESLKPLRQSTLALIQSLWQNASFVDSILVVGGPAPAVHGAIRKQYPQAVLHPDPQLAIVQGYLNYALLAEKQ